MSTKPPYSQSLELQNARDRVKELEQHLDGANGVIAMTIACLGGNVEGCPTHRGNFLQRIRELTAKEVEHKEFYRTELLKQKECSYYQGFFFDCIKLIPHNEQETTDDCMAKVIQTIKTFESQLIASRELNQKMFEALDRLSHICTCSRPAKMNSDGGITAPGPHTNRCVHLIANKVLALAREQGFGKQ